MEAAKQSCGYLTKNTCCESLAHAAGGTQIITKKMKKEGLQSILQIPDSLFDIPLFLLHLSLRDLDRASSYPSLHHS
jgi:hypothetical protein